MRANKYAPDMSLGDVCQFVLEHELEHDAKLVAVIDFTGGPGRRPFVSVGVLFGEGEGVLAGVPLVRQELPTSRLGGIVRVLMNACAEATAVLARSPWLWGVEARRRARGDDLGPGA